MDSTKNELAESIRRHRAAVEKNPRNELARFSLGKALYDTGELAEARAHFAAALERKPDWMVVRILLGKCHLALGERALARAEFEAAHALAVQPHHEGPQEELEKLLRDFGSAVEGA